MKYTITKEQFEEYLDIQESGLYNMFDPKARDLTSLSKSQWVNIITNYSIYHDKWGT
tara:strand:+ start:133 stop:303 length:171 start_codon:yes stop_codon:yes gene_type:complete